MEEICLRFPHIIEQISKVLDIKTLVKFKEADRIVCNIIDNQKKGRFFWTRVIQNVIQNNLSNCIEFKEDWKNVLKKTETEYLKKIAISLQIFFTSRLARRQDHWSPSQIALYQNDLELWVLLKFPGYNAYNVRK